MNKNYVMKYLFLQAKVCFGWCIKAEYHIQRCLKVHSCAQTWYLSILKCDSRVVVHSSIWTLCIPKYVYGAHKACFTLKHFDLGNHRNMYLQNARASKDMTLWTCTYTYVRAHWIVKNVTKQRFVWNRKHTCIFYVSKDSIILMNTYMKSAIAV